jgi:nucleoside-diphosphate-sugar epimerase
MKITFLGGSGFVASNVRPEFILDHTVQSVDRIPNHANNFFESVNGDINKEETLQKVKAFDPELIIVLAGQQYTSPQVRLKNRLHFFRGNVEIAETLSSSYRKTADVPRILYISTDMVYGIPDAGLIDESTSTNPIGDYGKSKLEAEKIYLGSFENVSIVRPRLIVGPGRVGTVKTLATLISRGLPIPIIGDGENRYQMIGVSDLWAAIETIITTRQDGIYNIGSDESPTLNRLFHDVKSDLKLSNPIIHINPTIAHSLLFIADRLNFSPLAYEQYALASKNCLLSTSKIKSLGWRPKFDDTYLFTNALSLLLNGRTPLD